MSSTGEKPCLGNPPRSSLTAVCIITDLRFHTLFAKYSDGQTDEVTGEAVVGEDGAVAWIRDSSLMSIEEAPLTEDELRRYFQSTNKGLPLTKKKFGEFIMSILDDYEALRKFAKDKLLNL